MQDSLYVMQSEICNQCSALRSGLVCSCWEDLLKIYWSLCKRHPGMPARRQLPWSKQDRTRDTTTVLGFWLHPLSSTV